MFRGDERSITAKKRTRQHVIAAQSVNYVERFILDEGHTAERIVSDYGYDLVLYFYDEEGYAEEGAVYLQLKASEKWKASGQNLVFDMDLRDYARWTREPMPVILILFDASKRCAYWLYVQHYFSASPQNKLGQSAKTVRIRIPKQQVVNRSAIKKMRAYKQRVLEQLEGVLDHA